ncbi:hypothetical protein [uncultured Muriicola sp.]|uniref:hypothetical protein n=1 Tax=uncultured Muriicola sp. TaxID=1583102 RepID=UPI00261913A9|nr:hypothetical protein [uncultured Muriicola sp.]
MDPNIIFEEDQRFTQLWLWLLMGGMLLIPIYGIVQQIVLKEPFGDNPMSDLGLIIFFIAMLALCGFFWMIRLQTTITKDEITINFPPLAKKRILWSDVEQAQIVKYSPLIGYGVRIWTPHGTVYNVKGNRGLFLILKNGKKCMIGTQRHREIEDLVHSLLK